MRRGNSQTTAKLRHAAERVVDGSRGESKGGLHPALLSPLASRPLASSCSLQRFNAILCKFVCGQVYMVPGLSVSSIHPSPLLFPFLDLSASRPARRPPPRFNPPPSASPCPPSLLHTLGQHRRKRINTHAIVSVHVCLYHGMYT